MSEKITVPTLGESVTEATVSKWLKSQGEKVSADEPLVELETDKVNVEVPSPLSGTLSSIKVKEGSTVEVGALLGVVNEEKIGSKICFMYALIVSYRTNIHIRDNHAGSKYLKYHLLSMVL